MSGSTIGGVVGGVIGFYFGGPQGAQWGWMIGSAVGGYVDPTVIKGPQLTDPQQQTASEGAPIPLVYGTYAVIGTIIQCQSVPTEHKHEEGGKGGPVQETFTYTRTVAILICRAAPLGGEMKLRRAWVNGKLAYDATGSGKLDADSAKFLAGMTFYSGSETQMPDPNLEALPEADGGGVGNVPAYRGDCYSVLPNCDVTQSGGAVPIIKWEVVSSGTEETALLNPNWIATNGNGGFVKSNGTDWTTSPYYTATATGNNLRFTNGRLLCIDNGDKRYSDDRGDTWPTTTITSGTIPSSTVPSTSVYGDNFWVRDRPWSGDGTTLTPVASIGANTPPAFGVGFGVSGYGGGYVNVSTDGFASHSNINIGVTDDVTVVVSNGTRVLGVGANNGKTSYTDNGTGWSSPYTLPSFTGSAACGAAEGNVFVIGSQFQASTGAVLWVSVDGGASFNLITLPEKFYIYDLQIDGGLIVAVGELNKGAGTPRIWTATVADPFTWTKRATNFGATDAVRGVAYMPCDGYAVPDAPGWYVHRDGSLCATEAHYVDPDTIYLDAIAGDLTSRGTVIDYDVTALSSIPVLGFAITQPTTASACLQELQKVYFWDYPEWGNSGDTYPKLRAVPRGGNSAVNLTDDDLVDVDDDEDIRRQAAEFPRKVNFIAPDPDHDYEPITQSSERESENITSTSEITISTAVAFTRDMAAPIADKMLRVACEEAQGQVKRTVPEEFTQFTTSDIVTYGGRRHRIDMIDAQDGESTWTLTRDRASAYESNAIGSVGVDVPDPVSSLRGPTIGLSMNLSSLRTSDNVPGIYLAACGLLAGWQGCDVYLSADGGTTETKVATIIDPATMGWLTADLDSSEMLSVNLYNDDELDDATDDQLALRMNACAVISENVAEILQFKDATDTGTKTYDLETLTRGELGTTEVNHFIDDDFVLLDGSVLFLPLDVSLAGKSLIFRFVTRGTTPANNPTQTVTFDPPTFVIDGGTSLS